MITFLPRASVTRRVSLLAPFLLPALALAATVSTDSSAFPALVSRTESPTDSPSAHALHFSASVCSNAIAANPQVSGGLVSAESTIAIPTLAFTSGTAAKVDGFFKADTSLLPPLVLSPSEELSPALPLTGVENQPAFQFEGIPFPLPAPSPLSGAGAAR